MTMSAQGSSPRLESAVFFFDPAGLNFAMETLKCRARWILLLNLNARLAQIAKQRVGRSIEKAVKQLLQRLLAQLVPADFGPISVRPPWLATRDEAAFLQAPE